MIVKVCAAARPAGRRDRHRARTSRSGIEHEVGGQRRTAAHVTLVTVTPPPPTVTVVAPTTKLVPVSVTATVVPRMP